MLSICVKKNGSEILKLTLCGNILERQRKTVKGVCGNINNFQRLVLAALLIYFDVFV